MKWDDELGALARKATVPDLIAAAPEDIETTKVVRGADAAAALKRELQRLLTAH